MKVEKQISVTLDTAEVETLGWIADLAQKTVDRELRGPGLRAETSLVLGTYDARQTQRIRTLLTEIFDL